MLSGGNSNENKKRLQHLIALALAYLKGYDRARSMHAKLAQALGQLLVVREFNHVRPPEVVGAPPALEKETEQTLGVLLALLAAIERYRIIVQDPAVFSQPWEHLINISTEVPIGSTIRTVTNTVKLNVTLAMYNFVCWAHTHGQTDRDEWITFGVARGLARLIPEDFYKMSKRNLEEVRADAAVQLLTRDRGISYASVYEDLCAAMKETGWEWVPSSDLVQ